MTICQEDHDQILADPNATTDELRSIIAELQAELAATQAALADNIDPASITRLPDGSGFFTASFPLPKDHWLYAPNCEGWDNERDCSPDTPLPILSNEQREAVKVALHGVCCNGGFDILKTWGEVFLDHKRKDEDHGSAALAADEYCRRADVWTPPEAIRAAHAAGFAGTSWIMGPEELAHLLNVAQKMSNA